MTSIVHCVAYRNGQPLGAISIDELSEVIKQPDTFVWLGLHEPDDPLLQKIQGEFALHELAIEDAHHAHQRPKIEAYSSSLFIVLKTAQLEVGQVVYGETNLFVGSNFMVSVRHGGVELRAGAAALRRQHERPTQGPGLCPVCGAGLRDRQPQAHRGAVRAGLRSPSRLTSSRTSSTGW